MADGTHRLTDEQADEMYERFGGRYLHVQTGDPYVANRKERRAGFGMSQAGYQVELLRKQEERRPKERVLPKLTAVKDSLSRAARRKAA